MVNLGPNAVLFDPNTGHFTTTKGQVSCVIHRLDIGVHGPTIKCRSMGLSEARRQRFSLGKSSLLRSRMSKIIW